MQAFSCWHRAWQYFAGVYYFHILSLVIFIWMSDTRISYVFAVIYSVNRKSCSRIYFFGWNDMAYSGRCWLLEIIIQNRTHNCTNVPHSIFFGCMHSEQKPFVSVEPGILLLTKRWEVEETVQKRKTIRAVRVRDKKISWHSTDISYVCDCFRTHSLPHRCEFNMHGSGNGYGDEWNEMWKINTFRTFQNGKHWGKKSLK